MDLSLSQKTVVVTGGAKGIGAGCASVFHREGANVAVLDVDREAGRELCENLGKRSTFIACDISNSSDVERAMERVFKEFGSLDILVNNAGILHYASVTETSEEEWDQLMGVNVKGAFLCSKFAIPYMQQQNRGVVVNISSVQAFVSQKRVAAYVTSKSALVGLTRSIAVDYAPHIRCVAVCPGGVDTPLNRAAFALSADPDRVRQETVDLHLIERMADQEEIGEFVAFVSSEKGALFTGQPVRIDGGLGVNVAGSKKD